MGRKCTAYNQINKTVHFELFRCFPINARINVRLDWLTEKFILSYKSNNVENPPTPFSNNIHGYKNGNDHLWILGDEKFPKLQILIAQRPGHGGKRRWRLILDTVRAHFW